MQSEHFNTIIYLFFIVYFTYRIYSKRKVFILSPVDIFIGFYFLAVIISTLYHHYYPNRIKFDLYNLDSLNRKNFPAQVNVFLRMITLFLSGVFFYKLFSKDYRIKSMQSIKIINTSNLNLNYKLIHTVTIYVFILCVTLVFLDYGSDLFYRRKYIPKDSSVFKTIYTVLLIVLSVLSAVLFDRFKKFSILVIMTVVLIGIALGSRMATIDLAVFLVTYSLFIKSRIKQVAYFAVVIPFIIIFFGYNLSLRLESSTHGLIPYLTLSPKKIATTFEHAQFNIYYTFVYGFYATSETIKLYSESVGKLITCMSPMPGSMTNWYLFAENMRINKYAPYTAVGELAKFPVFSFFYYIFLGFYFGFTDHFIKTQILKKRYFVPVLITLMLCLMTMFSFEYNLRSANRFVYYTAFLMLMSFIFFKLKSYKIVWK